MDQENYTEEEWDFMCERFQDPGGNSALHVATPHNPRIYPCPTCGKPHSLTFKDVKSGYQCDECADMAEQGLMP